MRTLPLIVAPIVLYAGSALAVPMLQVPPPRLVEESSQPSVAETRWSGTFDWANGERRDATLYFRSDGVLIYAYGGNTFDNGRWVQRDRLITFNTNDYFAVFTGVLEGWAFAGTSYNRGGDTGQFSFTRNAPPSPDPRGIKD